MRAARVDEIVKLVPRAQVNRSRRLGDFAWPQGMEPETWKGFRIAGTAGSRTLEEVAPQEIANAMQAVLEEYPDLEYVDEVLRPTAELFGIVRLGANVRARLEEIYESLQSNSRDAADSGD